MPCCSMALATPAGGETWKRMHASTPIAPDRPHGKASSMKQRSGRAGPACTGDVSRHDHPGLEARTLAVAEIDTLRQTRGAPV